VADERSVDMDEVTDQPPERGSHPPIPAARARLSPVQEASQARAAHKKACQQCSDIDRQQCALGEQLWKDWTAALDDAYQKLHGAH
jgi:hypothetical protein